MSPGNKWTQEWTRERDVDGNRRGERCARVLLEQTVHVLCCSAALASPVLALSFIYLLLSVTFHGLRSVNCFQISGHHRQEANAISLFRPTIFKELKNFNFAWYNFHVVPFFFFFFSESYENYFSFFSRTGQYYFSRKLFDYIVIIFLFYEAMKFWNLQLSCLRFRLRFKRKEKEIESGNLRFERIWERIVKYF